MGGLVRKYLTTSIDTPTIHAAPRAWHSWHLPGASAQNSTRFIKIAPRSQDSLSLSATHTINHQRTRVLIEDVDISHFFALSVTIAAPPAAPSNVANSSSDHEVPRGGGGGGLAAADAGGGGVADEDAAGAVAL